LTKKVTTLTPKLQRRSNTYAKATATAQKSQGAAIARALLQAHQPALHKKHALHLFYSALIEKTSNVKK